MSENQPAPQPESESEAQPTQLSPDLLVPATSGGCLRWMLSGCGAMIVLTGLLLIFGVTTLNNIFGGFNQMLGRTPPTARITDTQTIVQSVLPLGQLVSVSVQLAKADIEVGVVSGALNACGYSVNHVAQGAVEAGIDLSGFSEDDIVLDETRDVVVVNLPPAQLTSCRIDFIRQYDRSISACNPDWDEARLLAQYEAMNDFRADAIEAGILDRAERESRLILASLINALTGKEVEIVFRDADEATLPPSCQPPVPDDWTYDESTGSWVKNG
jgi:hypothetical protein